MAVYNISGNVLPTCYDAAGDFLSTAYDISGNLVYTLGETFKVMTYNVGQWYIGTTSKVPTAKKSEYSAIHNHAFSTYQPDVLCLQEATATWCDDGSTTADLLVPYFDEMESSRTSTNYQGHYICTDGYPISNYTVHDFSVSNPGNYPAFETGEIIVGGKTITIVNTHHSTTGSTQQTEISDILSVIDNLDYFILCGDFNNGAVSVGDNQYNINIKPFLDRGYHVGNCVLDWIYTYFDSADPVGTRYRTDNIITSSNIYIASLEADTTKLTDSVDDKIDHIPLIAELIIT